MKLTNLKVQSTQADGKPLKLYDGQGLFLEISPSGLKSWRIKYTLHGKQRTYSIGRYPQMSLAEARHSACEKRLEMSKGIDPAIEKKVQKLQNSKDSKNSFEAFAKDWFEGHKDNWTPKYSNLVKRRLERHVFPSIGEIPLKKVNAQHVVSLLKSIESDGNLELVRKIKVVIGQVLRYGVITGCCERDFTHDLKGLLKTRKVKHNPILTEADLPHFMQRLSNYDGSPRTKLAVEFLMQTMVRTKELRGARWDEFDLQNGIWRIPAERMKMDKPHVTPINSRAIQILRDIWGLRLSDVNVFPNSNDSSKVMSENTILYALYRMGYRGKLTGHGFRGTASTILNEHGFNSDWIEKQLAHCPKDSVRAAYNHAQDLPQRKQMMEWWAEFLIVASTSSFSNFTEIETPTAIMGLPWPTSKEPRNLRYTDGQYR